MSKIRTFFAVNLSTKILKNASRVIDRLADTRAGYRWCREENLHVTLNFVGDVMENEVAQLCLDAKKTLEGMRPFMMAVGGIGCFPNLDTPRTIWLGVTEGSDELVELNQRIDRLLERWGFPKDRLDFHPHVTLARLKKGGRWNEALMQKFEELKSHDAGMCEVSEVVVNSSYLDKSGPTYTPMMRIKLG